ncbi:MAG TPA: endonuclease/exonuclease/phosphatase family protein [Gillisia sp.]|nr:endonuclease/exonuclease/phosphatase family protein [Gillisia sp.]
MKLHFPRFNHFVLLTLFLFSTSLFVAQVKISSWNLQNFGKTKTEAEIEFMANILKDFDIIALQEVVAGYGGAQAVARLADELNRKGSKWDYVISDPTNSSPYATERYAYIWKTAQIKRSGRPWLEKKYESEIDREPFFMDFNYNGTIFTLVNFHAIPKKKQPETEIKYFKFLPGHYADKNLIFLGDFNVPQSHTVFNPLKKMGYEPVFIGQKTTMKMKCVGGECLASEYDNIFYNTNSSTLLDFGVVLFYESYPDMKSARRISDHIPLWAEFDFVKDGEGDQTLSAETP